MALRFYSLRDLRLLVATSCLLLFTAAAHAFVPNAPAALGAAVRDLNTTTNSNTVYFTFDDNSTNETGFDLTYTLNNGAEQHFQVLSGDINYTTATTTGTGNVIIALGLPTNGVSTWKVAAYAGSATAGNTSAYTNLISVSTYDFNTPAIALMTNTNETALRFANVDNASGEAGYFYEYRVPPAAFATAYISGANVSNLNLSGFAPGTAYEFRIRGFKGTSASPTSLTAYSNTYAISTPFSAPTGFTATVNNDSTVSFTWADNSSAETGYEIQYSISGANNFKKLGAASANATSITLGGFGPGQSSLSPNQAYDFKVRAIYNDGAAVSSSAFSSVVTKSTKDGFTSATYKQIPCNQPFTYQAVVTAAASRSTWSISNLPGGLTFNPSTGQITGTPTAPGVTNCPMTSSFVGGATASTTLTLRVVLPPTIATTIPAQYVASGGNTSIPLSDKFTDPDTTSAARLVTSQGTMDFILYDTATTTQNATPQTVANFLSYIRNYGVSDTTNKYDGAVFHRSIPGFIVQGGAFKVQSSPNNFSSIVTAPSPINEPVNSNTRGTVAMAKLGSDPNSATDQFFVNLADNSGNLDLQNGGFTAFARVAGNGMAVAEAIAALPMVDSLVNVGGSPTTTLTDWPLSSSSVSMDTSKVVSITSATKNVPVLTYAITGNTNAFAVTPSINTVVDGSGNSSSTLQLASFAGGQSTVTVTATDLDGNSVSQTFTVTVAQAPTVSSPSSTSITATTATLGGNVSSDGGAPITERGVVYSPTATNNNPALNGTGVIKLVASGTTGVFTTPATGLAPGTGYSFKAYATNGVGTTYTSVSSFTTSTQAPTVNTPTTASITATGATLGGTVASDGGATITERGIVYSVTTTNPDPVINGSGVIKVPTTGTTGVFTAPVTGLSPNTGYSFKAYAINSLGTTYTTPAATFATSALSPTVTTATSASITGTTATLGGTVASDGGSTITERGIVYSVTTTNPDPIINGAGVIKVTTTGTTGIFTTPVTGLSPNTGYSFKAYAINSIGTTYTSVSTFTTPTQAPTVTTASTASITSTTATLGGNVTSDGGSAITERGVVYSVTTTNPDPLINGSGVTKLMSSGTTGVFTANAASLAPNTGYSFKAYAINSVGTTYTSPVSNFTTSATPPGATTLAASAITSTSVTLNGSIVANNSSTTVSFDYGTSASYGTNVAATPGTVTGSTTTGVSTNVTGLAPGTTYHFRVNGTSTAGTTNGTDLTFTTLSSLQSWRQTYFGTTANTGNTADNADYDKDGIPNLIEYALKLDPTTASKLTYTAVVNGANFEYTYSRSTAAVNAGLIINVEWINTFASGSWSTAGVTQNILSDDGTTQQVKAVIPTNSATAKYVRLSVSPPL
ncbi:fibronectin type III domain-containing protein [Prosthecobacter sp.]|uniref:fibronectin type III domain-containing protein n=1 Tax=Prosthecobacter sp. TaxID=1965333 RepID=UPI0037848A67